MTLLLYVVYLFAYGSIACLIKVEHPFDNTALIVLAILAAAEAIRMK